MPEYLTGEEYCTYLHVLKGNKLDKYTFESLCQLFNLEKDKDKLIEQYSYGMKKKIQFITGILLKCKLYIFDELTSGLDIETILLIEKILLSKKATFVVSSHEISTGFGVDIKMLITYCTVIGIALIIELLSKRNVKPAH